MKDKLKRLALVLASAMLFCTALTGCFGGGGTSTPVPRKNKYAVLGDVWLRNPEVWLTTVENVENLSVTMRILQVSKETVAAVASDNEAVNALAALLIEDIKDEEETTPDTSDDSEDKITLIKKAEDGSWEIGATDSGLLGIKGLGGLIKANRVEGESLFTVRMIFMENKDSSKEQEGEEQESGKVAIGMTIEAGKYVVGYTVIDGKWTPVNTPDESLTGMKDTLWRKILGDVVDDEGIHAFLLEMFKDNLAEVEQMKAIYEEVTSGTTGGESTVSLYSFDEPFAGEEFTAYELMDELSDLSYDIVLEQQLEQMAWSLAF